MSDRNLHDFGVVDEKGDYFEFRLQDTIIGEWRLDEVIQTERGPRRSELAAIPASVWGEISERVIRELAAGMGDMERTKKLPTMKPGKNRLSPLIGRELAVLLWALMEIPPEGNTEAILHGWRELAREERWWLFTKGAAPGQKTGSGWRLALFHALSEVKDSRTEDLSTKEKKSPGSGSRSGKKTDPKKESTKSSNKQPEKPASKNLLKQKPETSSSSQKKDSATPKSKTKHDTKQNKTETPPEKKAKRKTTVATVK